MALGVLNGRFQFQRATKKEWEDSNIVLLDGELALESDTTKIKAGDGKTIYADLPYISIGDFSFADLTEEDKARVKGPKGDPFRYEDFTQKQLDQLLDQLTDDSTHRLVTDAEKAEWNAKAEKSYVDSAKASLSTDITNKYNSLNTAKAEKSYVDSSIASVNKEINSIENRIASSLESRLKQLESALYEDITGNPFTITFNDINGLNLTNGVFNESKVRLEC